MLEMTANRKSSKTLRPCFLVGFAIIIIIVVTDIEQGLCLAWIMLVERLRLCSTPGPRFEIKLLASPCTLA